MGCGTSKPRVNDNEAKGIPIQTPSRVVKMKNGGNTAFDTVTPHTSSSDAFRAREGDSPLLDRQGSASYQMWQSIGDLVLDDATATAAAPSTRNIEDGARDSYYYDEDSVSLDDEVDGGKGSEAVSRRSGGGQTALHHTEDEKAHLAAVETTFVPVPGGTATSFSPVDITVHDNDVEEAGEVELRRASLVAGISASMGDMDKPYGTFNGAIDRMSSLGADPSSTIVADADDEDDASFAGFELLEGEYYNEDGEENVNDGGSGGRGGIGRARGGKATCSGKTVLEKFRDVDELELNERLRAAFGDDTAAGWSYINDFEVSE